MAQTGFRLAVVAVIFLAGWITARAQASQPAFEVVVNAPSGETTIECVRGCELAWVERGINPNATPMPTFTFKCSGTSRCSSLKVGGWLKP